MGRLAFLLYFLGRLTVPLIVVAALAYAVWWVGPHHRALWDILQRRAEFCFASGNCSLDRWVDFAQYAAAGVVFWAGWDE